MKVCEKAQFADVWHKIGIWPTLQNIVSTNSKLIMFSSPPRVPNEILLPCSLLADHLQINGSIDDPTAVS